MRRRDHVKTRRRSTRLHSAVLVGATALFVPHAGKAISFKSSRIGATAASDVSRGTVITTAEFRLPASYSYNHLIDEAARQFKLQPALLRAVIQTESAFDHLAVSPVGAQGLMQLMPALSRELGVDDPFDPRQNIMAGARYLATLLQMHGGNLPLALASYNAGPGAVAMHGGIPPFPETQQYVAKVTRILSDGL